MPNFLAFMDEAATLELEFQGSRAVSASGGLKIYDAQGRRLGTVSLFHFSGQGTSIEFNLIPMSRLSDEDWPAETAVESFLNELSNTPGLTEIGENLRYSHFTTRRPNVSLVALEEDSLRRGLRATRLLRGNRSGSGTSSGGESRDQE
ncbi:hypothetical protein QNO08_03050 [Arthrobacter sp. zg-Y820]|uniref:hypothetical protein n=1 Tax=unclassified Arthrobacter TaxID=235627 RepID=UPI001E4F1510|nr:MULTISPECIES: hypothetical protein [unclassified Arthrobacter]MCC9195311.1 hypothetical protein [Arthrobacter sp. zg-Y820]MDK1278170.1 hypothetical protein [Arthrobacter sp. zg.Y820]WIB10056.1 hypothetical protein QNO08_03050 [Arthrobacter sp. zg-Y820]